MRSSVALLLVAAGIVSAATTTTTSAAATSTASCAAQSVFDLCIQSTTDILNTCTPADYICMCQKQSAVLQCYDTCPNDPLYSSAKGTNASYCQAAAQQSSASVSVSGTPTIVSSTVRTTSTASTTSGTASAASNTSSSARASSTGAATNMYAPVGGLAAVALGVVGLL